MALQPIGNESDIPSTNIDWDNLGKAAKAIDEKYNGVRADKPIRLATQKAGNIYATKAQQNMGVFEDNNVLAPEKKAAETVEVSLPKKLSGLFSTTDRLQSSSSVTSARCGSEGVTDIGGPSKYIKSETAPSIWDSGVLERAAQELDSKRKTQQEKGQIVEARKTIRQQADDNLIAMLQGTDQRKAANIAPVSDQVPQEEGARFAKPTRNMSIFDCMGSTSEFSRLPEKSAGEKVTESRRARKERLAADDSWKDNHHPVTSKGIVDRLFETLNPEGDKE